VCPIGATPDPLDELLARLVPRPHRVDRSDGAWRLPSSLAIANAADDGRPARALRRGLQDLGCRITETADGGAAIRLELDAGCAPAQGYVLEVTPCGARLVGADPAGLAYAGHTLVQLARLCTRPGQRAALPALTIRDAPDFPVRGVQLDVSRDKVPTFETLCALVDRLASWKINQLQLYTEHAFAYPGHEVVWQGASPITPFEARELDRFCAERFVELVPNQQSFGHLHRWLVHEPYRALAETPEGIEHPFSPKREPYGLCPLDPGSLTFLAGLYDELLPCFGSELLNVGLDETVDLGLGRSRERCAELGTDRVYLDFLLAVRRLAADRGRRIQVFADVMLEAPELLHELPGDVIPLVWGYEADHPFDEQLTAATAAGHDVYVCPGTSSWNSLGGRTRNAIGNLIAAARQGRAHDARGYLVTDWGDRGHLQPAPVSEPGFLLGAALAWNADDDASLLAERLDAHVFRDAAGVTGECVLELGRACDVARSEIPNGSALFFLLERAAEDLPHPRAAGVDAASLRAALQHVRQALEPLERARLATPDARTTLAELVWTGDALALACRLGLARLAGKPPLPTASLPETVRLELAIELERLIAGHRAQWLARNRPGGLGDSAERLLVPLRLLAHENGSTA